MTDRWVFPAFNIAFLFPLEHTEFLWNRDVLLILWLAHVLVGERAGATREHGLASLKAACWLGARSRRLRAVSGVACT